MAVKLEKADSNFYKYFRFIIIPVVFCSYYLLSFMIDPFRSWSNFFSRASSDIIKEWGVVLIFCFLLTEISLFIIRKLDQKISWIQRPLPRVLFQFGIQILATVILLYIHLHVTFWIFGGDKKLSEINPLALRQTFVASVLLSLLISLIYTGNFFLQQWKAATLETSNLNLKASELKQIALESELQSFKMQLDPHFMFNNFSTLSALIAEDQNAAQHFLENLSRVYRYMIINVHKNIISVEEEIRFAKAYFYLIKIRLGENIKLKLDLNTEILQMGIPPLTIQLLIENAIKHNMACRSKPLTISIAADPDTNNLIISNSLQRLNYNIPSTGTGLKNIESRYRLLSNDLPEVYEADNLFIVKLPLMDL
jgi:two-component system LytT family sensor kinase